MRARRRRRDPIRAMNADRTFRLKNADGDTARLYVGGGAVV